MNNGRSKNNAARPKKPPDPTIIDNSANKRPREKSDLPNPKKQPPGKKVCNTNTDSPLDKAIDIECDPASDSDTASVSFLSIGCDSPPNLVSNDNNSHPQTSTNSSNNTAKLNLDNLTELPDNINQIILASTDTEHKLTTYNPEKIRRGIGEICGEVLNAEYLKSGNILVTVKTKNQLNLLKAANLFPILNLPIIAKIAWTHQFTYGKLWAPELGRDSLEEILDLFKDQNVIAVRKLFADPNRSHLPLYVFTFLGPLPSEIKLGYQIIKLDKYIPSPLVCKNCWRFGHSARACRSKSTCSKCSSTSHLVDQCNNTPKCTNCKANHASNDKSCPTYNLEKEVCSLTATHGISFIEARAIIHGRKHATGLTLNKQHPPTLNGRNFPLLPSAANQLRNAAMPSTGTSSGHNATVSESDSCHSSPPSASISNHNIFPTLALKPTALPPISPHQGTPTELVFSQFTESSQIPPGQGNSTNINTCISTAEPTLSLPQYSPVHQPSFSDIFANLPETNSEHRSSHTKQRAHNNNTNASQNIFGKIISSLPELITLIVKIIFSKNQTETIEHIVNIGHLLDIGNLITNALPNMFPNLSQYSNHDQ